MPENDERPNEYECSEPWLGSFLNLDKPRTISKSSTEKPKFSANFEIAKDHPDVARLRAAIVACAHEEWPQLDVGAAIKDGRLQVPLSDGDKLADKAARENEDAGHKNYKKNRLREWSRGKSVLIARSEFLPPTVVRENGVAQALADQDAVSRLKNKFFFTGVDCYFAVKLNAYNGVGTNGLPGVNAYLLHTESLGTGTHLIKGRDPTERFSHYRGLATQEDPTREPATADSDW